MTLDATLWLPYTQMQTVLPPIEVVRAEGSILFLKDGTRLIDGVASWWTACHGYQHPHIIQAIQQQLTQLPHVMMGGIIHPQAQKLSQRLAQLLPGDLNHVFLSDSGSVAIEIAMKMAMQYWMNLNQPQRQRFISFQDGYHGDTFFAMSVCDPIMGMHHRFHSVLPAQHCCTFPHDDDSLKAFDQWLAIHAQEIAGVMIEPLVQAAGGMKMHSPAALKALCDLCKKYDLLIIMDEIFTGFGRTGSLFAFTQADTLPDIICLSKALTGGTLPLAATIARRHVYDAFLDNDPEKALMHGSTFMGNALACAAANASLDLFETEPRLGQAADQEGFLFNALMPLNDIQGVKEVRVKGAIAVIQLQKLLSTEELNWLKQQFVNDGIWCRPFKDIIYTTPALTIKTEELHQITDVMSRQVKRWSKTFYAV